MRIDFTQTIHDINGVAFPDGDKSLTLSAVSIAALLQNYPDEPNLAGEEKFQRYDLATRVNNKASADISFEDIAKIRSLIGKLFGPSVVGPSYILLEGRSTQPVATAEVATPTKRPRKKALEAVPTDATTTETAAQ